MKFIPHPFQAAGIDHGVTALLEKRTQLYAAPTGCGKSIVQLGVQSLVDDTWIITPREEIAFGMLDKLGAPDGAEMMDFHISTPIRLRNRLLEGAIRHPGHLIYDEGHHHNAETYQQLDLLTGLAPSIAYTATPYRGTPRGTREFLERWGEPLWLIDYAEAESMGYITMPTFETLPLVDDDIVDVRGGEFDITSIDGATVDRLGDIAERARMWYSDKWDKPTIFALPSSGCCTRLQQELARRGMPAAIVSAETRGRQDIFQAVVSGTLALLHINIVTEGVDLPLRRLVDLAPTLSPVKWVQQLGRITRPSQTKPEYICTNRNIMRHAYILEGAVPCSAVADSMRVFPPSERATCSRVLGLEAIGRFKPTTVKLLSGVSVYLYALSVPVGTTVIEYCCVAHPTMEPLWVTKVNTIQDGERKYGDWRLCTEPPTDLRGFASLPPRALSDKQAAWWKRSAASFGIDPQQEVTKKNFQLLPVLVNTGRRYA